MGYGFIFPVCFLYPLSRFPTRACLFILCIASLGIFYKRVSWNSRFTSTYHVCLWRNRSYINTLFTMGLKDVILELKIYNFTRIIKHENDITVYTTSWIIKHTNDVTLQFSYATFTGSTPILSIGNQLSFGGVLFLVFLFYRYFFFPFVLVFFGLFYFAFLSLFGFASSFFIYFFIIMKRKFKQWWSANLNHNIYMTLEIIHFSPIPPWNVGKKKMACKHFKTGNISIKHNTGCFTVISWKGE